MWVMGGIVAVIGIIQRNRLTDYCLVLEYRGFFVTYDPRTRPYQQIHSIIHLSLLVHEGDGHVLRDGLSRGARGFWDLFAGDTRV